MGTTKWRGVFFFRLVFRLAAEKCINREFPSLYLDHQPRAITSRVANSPSASGRTTSRTPTVSPSRDFREVARLLKMKPSLYHDE